MLFVRDSDSISIAGRSGRPSPALFAKQNCLPLFSGVLDCAFESRADGSVRHLLTTITNSADTALLSLAYTGGLLTSISDAYGRSACYQSGTFGSGPTAELTEVSQLVSTGTVNPPLRYTYDHQI
ncbi:MAG TPA: hypothetical protein VFJ58_11560 [Armatimonadota bacterium]|nr:hypothetical protein [Armatimonadota bacterium]